MFIFSSVRVPSFANIAPVAWSPAAAYRSEQITIVLSIHTFPDCRDGCDSALGFIPVDFAPDFLLVHAFVLKQRVYRNLAEIMNSDCCTLIESILLALGNFRANNAVA